jgi:hypothetical protein
MKYIKINYIIKTTQHLDDFIEDFKKKFGERMELTVDNLRKLSGDKWNLYACLCSFIPEGEEREKFFDHNRTNYQKMCDHLEKYCDKDSLVDKIVKSARQ